MRLFALLVCCLFGVLTRRVCDFEEVCCLFWYELLVFGVCVYVLCVVLMCLLFVLVCLFLLVFKLMFVLIRLVFVCLFWNARV